jgi:L-ascorbate metabolism protein UlaG (beta-lactamase superfamily)
VLLSHCHYGHLDLATLRRLHARDAPLMAMPLGNDVIVRRAIPNARAVVGNWHERLQLPGGLATTTGTAAASAEHPSTVAVSAIRGSALAWDAAARTFPPSGPRNVTFASSSTSDLAASFLIGEMAAAMPTVRPDNPGFMACSSRVLS